MTVGRVNTWASARTNTAADTDSNVASGATPSVGQPEPADDLESGTLVVRLAHDEADILASQRLRYRVFYDEMKAHPSPKMAREGRDFDRYDGVCDHLLVIDRSLGDGPDGVVGTYRLLRRSQRQGLPFYTAGEFDIAAIEAYEGEILELGRSCVDAAYRTRPTLQLLWTGIAAYCFRHDVKLLFGCASLPGTDVPEMALPLAYLWHCHLAPEAVRARALPAYYTTMNLMAVDAIDPRRAMASLPPLLRGYLRLGGFIGDGAVVDPQFNTTDVCMILEADKITGKYYRHFSRTSRDRSLD